MNAIRLGAGLAMSILAVLGLGVYLVVVIDRVIGDLVASSKTGWRRAFAAPMHDVALALLQRRAATERPDAPLWALAPALLGGLAGMTLVVVPLGEGTGGAELPSGIVYLGALLAMVMVAVFVHGWSVNSPFPLVGGYRFVAQALSYEMPLALVLIAAALPAQSLSMHDIVRSQASAWNVVRQPLGLPLYLVAGMGLAFWGPLNTADAADIAGGTSAESAGVQWLGWRAARAAVLIAVAAVGATAFLGGWLGPLLPGWIWVSVKTFTLLVLMLAVGHLLARVRLERFVTIAWVVLIPLALVDVFLSGLLALHAAGST